MLVFKGTLESDFEIKGMIADAENTVTGSVSAKRQSFVAHEQFRKKPPRPKLMGASYWRRS